MGKRINVYASEIVTPTFQTIKDAGCKDDITSTCPMMSNYTPDDRNGCNSCRKIKGTWLLRKEVLKVVTESELKEIRYYDFDSDDKVRRLIEDNYERLGYFSSEPLFDFIKLYCSFEADSYAITVEKNGKQIIDGRHRIKIAQNMDLKIPVHWL